jgi:hypothetical protein
MFKYILVLLALGEIKSMYSKALDTDGTKATKGLP